MIANICRYQSADGEFNSFSLLDKMDLCVSFDIHWHYVCTTQVSIKSLTDLSLLTVVLVLVVHLFSCHRQNLTAQFPLKSSLDSQLSPEKI